MTSHMQNALKLLGLDSGDNPATLWKHYKVRLVVLQNALVNARTEQEQHLAQTRLARLVAAYQFVRKSNDTSPPVDREAVTLFRVETEAAAQVGDPAATVLGPGSVLQGRYEIEAELGDGGMGCVFAARDRLKNEDVAIKVLRSELLSSAAARERFITEAKISCRLSHPNIVRVFDVGVANGRYFFTMERLNGTSLRSRMQAQLATGRPFGIEEATVIAEQLLDALRHAHTFIVHRDLKPENIWLDEAGAVKLMDFGIARALLQGQVTRTGMSMGTAYYMAPEQHTDAKDVDWRADQYAFAVIMYEMLTGRVPMGAVQPIEKLRRDIPKPFARAIMKAMSPRREARFASMREMQNVFALRREADVPGAILAAIGRAVVLGTTAGTVFAYFDCLSLSRIHEWMYPSGVAVGIGTALLVELGEYFFRSRFRWHTFAAFTTAVLWIAIVLLVAQRLSALSNGLVVMLCGSIWASGMDYITRRFRIAEGRYRMPVAVFAGLFGTLLGLMLLFEVDMGANRNYLYSGLSGMIPAMIIASASLRRRMWRRRDSLASALRKYAPRSHSGAG